MGRFTWIAGLVLCVGLADRQTASGQPLIQVLVMDQAEVPPVTRQRAQDVATRVFHLAGIALVWVDATTCQARCLRVRIVTQPVSAKSRDPHMLGVALRMPEARGINLWVFYPRIRAYSAELGLDRSELLGYVMAHELGHLLLPDGAHSLAGLMRREMGSSAGASRRRGPVDLYTGSGRPDTRGAASFRFAYCTCSVMRGSRFVGSAAVSMSASSALRSPELPSATAMFLGTPLAAQLRRGHSVRRVPASKDPHGPFPSAFPPPCPRPAFAGREKGVAKWAAIAGSLGWRWWRPVWREQ